VLAWLIISFNEELAFRGYILQRLARAWGMPAAVVASSLIFMMVHALNPNVQPLAMVSLFLAGILLACAYLVSRSLWLPIGLHIGWNLAEVHLLGFSGSGVAEPAALLRSLVHGPELATGGAFGPEGGLVGLAATTLGIFILLIGYQFVVRNKNKA
jgi:membrane protease YdiL (CAAX protease family)